MKYKRITRDPNLMEYIEKGINASAYILLKSILALTCPIWGPFYLIGKFVDGQVTERVYYCPEDNYKLQKTYSFDDGDFKLRCPDCGKEYYSNHYKLQKVEKSG